MVNKYPQNNGVGILIVVAALSLFAISQKEREPVEPKVDVTSDKVIKTAKQTALSYLEEMGQGFIDVGNQAVDGEITKVSELHDALGEKNDDALDKYVTLNKLIQDADQQDMEELGRLCIKIGKGVKQAKAR